MQRRRAVHAAGLGALGALALAGCASQPPAAGEAWEQARAQIDGAESVRMSFVSTDGSQTPRVITWDLAGPLEGTDGTTEASMLVGEDSWMTVDTRTVDGRSYARITTQGQDVPAQVAAQYHTEGWRETAPPSQGSPIGGTLDAVALPAADALAGADVQPEKVEWSGGTAHRYQVPTQAAEAARQEGDTFTVRAFTVDEDGSLVGLRVEDGTQIQELTLTDWNQIDPAEVPEEVEQ